MEKLKFRPPEPGRLLKGNPPLPGSEQAPSRLMPRHGHGEQRDPRERQSSHCEGALDLTAPENQKKLIEALFVLVASGQKKEKRELCFASYLLFQELVQL